MTTTTKEEVLSLLPPIPVNSNKFTRGRLFMVCGSYGMAGTSTQYSAGGGGGLYGGGGARHQYTGGGSGYIGGVQNGSMQSGVNDGSGEVLIVWTE